MCTYASWRPPGSILTPCQDPGASCNNANILPTLPLPSPATPSPPQNLSLVSRWGLLPDTLPPQWSSLLSVQYFLSIPFSKPCHWTRCGDTVLAVLVFLFTELCNLLLLVIGDKELKIWCWIRVFLFLSEQLPATPDRWTYFFKTYLCIWKDCKEICEIT